MAEVRLQEGESLEDALRRFKRKVLAEDIIRDVKRHSYHLKPGEKRRVKQAFGAKACPEEDSHRAGLSRNPPVSATIAGDISFSRFCSILLYIEKAGRIIRPCLGRPLYRAFVVGAEIPTGGGPCRPRRLWRPSSKYRSAD